MVANAIAFLLTAIFLSIAFFGFYKVGKDQIPEEKENAYVLVCFIFLFAAWGCAKMGGI